MINKTLLLACIPVLLACGSDSPTPPLQPTITVPTLPPSTDDTDDADDDEEQDNSNITFTGAQLKFPTKKGACYTLRDPSKNGDYLTNMPKVEALNVGWNYSWGTGIAPNQSDDIEFVPMTWGSFNADNLTANLQPKFEAGLYKRILAFNEPDGEKQANMTVDKAIALWPTLESFRVPLGSPAIVNAETGEWLEEFMKQVDEKSYRVDYICVHNYGGGSVSAFQKKMTNIYEKYKRPLLITEFAVADWTAKSPEENKHSKAKVLKFMQGVLPWIEEQSFIYAYSWFPFGQQSAAGTSSALFDGEGNLTELGQYYAQFKP